MPKHTKLEITVEAKTVQDAINKALKKLKLRRDQVEVNIIEKEKSGFLGLGAKKAKVSVREKKWTHIRSDKSEKPQMREKKFKKTNPPQRYKTKNTFVKHKPVSNGSFAKTAQSEIKPVPAEFAKNAELAEKTLARILSYFDEKDAQIKIGWDNLQERLIADFKCRDPQIIIGREGTTLQAIQYLVTLIISRKTGVETPFQADTENYWRDYENKIISFADYGVKNVKCSGKPFRLRAMPPAMRRFVHKYLAQKPGIETASEGEGKWRKVVIYPKK